MASSSSSGVKKPRLIVVSNRLRVTVKGEKPENYQYVESSGGLVSAFSGLGMEFIWIGSPDINPPDKYQDSLRATLLSKYGSVPVWVNAKLVNGYYNGFSNGVLWPLLHDQNADMSLEKANWQDYKDVNSLFARTINEQLQDGDLVWIQDYHLMLLPQMLRELITKKNVKNVKIGFFLHTAFPEFGTYSKLSFRKELLQGVLQSNLVSFHTLDYARNFRDSCTRIFELPPSANKVEVDGHYAYTGTFPIGIDPEKFTKSLKDNKVIDHIEKLKKKYSGVKIILGVDRLDYIKGVPEKMEAMEEYLIQHPNELNKVVLIQIAVPTRQDVKEYKDLRTSVEKIVDRVNHKHHTARFPPIDFRYESVKHEELVALYVVSDACLVTSTRDGMNLVSYEYIASQNDKDDEKKDKNAVLILSEFAGAAKCLDGALLVNPWNKVDLADKIHKALNMLDKDRCSRYNKLWKYVKKNTAALWGENFLKQLKESEQISLAPLEDKSVVEAFKKSSKKKVILLNYDSMLTVDTAKPSEEVLKELKTLTSKRDTYVYILSGHTRDHLKKWFDTTGTGVGLSAEYGCYYKHPSSIATTIKNAKGKEDGGWRRLAEKMDPRSKESILKLLKGYKEQTPRSSIEEKEINLAWEYHNIDHELVRANAKQLRIELEIYKTLAVVPIDKRVELCPKGIDKSTAVSAILEDLKATSDVDFILCLGDGKTEEVVFATLNKISKGRVFTSIVGKKQTVAKSYVENVETARKLLKLVAA